MCQTVRMQIDLDNEIIEQRPPQLTRFHPYSPCRVKALSLFQAPSSPHKKMWCVNVDTLILEQKRSAAGGEEVLNVSDKSMK